MQHYLPINSQGTHKSLRRNENAKATVAAILDGTGSLGAAFGPLIAGAVSEYVSQILFLKSIASDTFKWMAVFFFH